MAAPRYLFDVEQILNDGRVKQSDVDVIKAWSIGQKHVPDLSDQQIIVFLLACCNNHEETKLAILAFYSIQRKTPELFGDRSLKRDDLQKALNTIRFGVSPERTSQNYAVLLVKLNDTAYYNLDMGPGIKLGIMSLQSIIYDNPPDGFITVLDMNGVGLMHLTRVVFRLLKPFFRYVQEALPVRLEEILIINTVYFINKVMAIIKPFMNPQLIEKLHFHTPDMNMEDFFTQFVEMKCIPEDYGGSVPALDKLHALNVEKLTQMSTFFDVDEVQRNGIEI